MAENTNISWARHTFNPWLGCQKVSPGCDFCYAEAWAKRSGLVTWGPGESRRLTSPANWRKPLLWDKRAREAGVRERVFCASLADVFDNAVPEEWRSRLFEMVALTPSLDWLLLTKRPQNIPALRFEADILPNVWLGTTTENQTEFDRRAPHLVAHHPAVRFLSVEPMLGPVDISAHADRIDWIICGGESGPRHRPMDPAWARDLRDQCAEHGIPFWFKQHSHRFPGRAPLLDGVEYHQLPELSLVH